MDLEIADSLEIVDSLEIADLAGPAFSSEQASIIGADLVIAGASEIADLVAIAASCVAAAKPR